MWWGIYESLDLHGGKINYIGDELEDMIEIFYQDGMLIDIGKSLQDNIYYITVVSSDDIKGWKNPLEIISVPDKKNLYDKIQETIEKYQWQQ